MSGELDLYCALRDIEVPAEKARAVVEALATMRQERSARTHTKTLQQLQGELDAKLWDLKFKAMTDEITVKFGVFMLLVAACEIIMHIYRMA